MRRNAGLVDTGVNRREAFRSGGRNMEKARTVALCSFKGGTGKTTLSLNLAERAWSRGLAVGLLDCDPQRGAARVMEMRRGEGWSVMTGKVDLEGSKQLGALKEKGGYDLLVCDMPGVDSASLVSFLRQMDLVLSPVGVSSPELLVAQNFHELVESMGLERPVVYVANNVPPGKSRADVFSNDLAELVGDVAPIWVRRRVVHVDAVRSGQGVCEMAPRSEAAAEITALWTWTAERLELECWQGA